MKKTYFLGFSLIVFIYHSAWAAGPYVNDPAESAARPAPYSNQNLSEEDQEILKKGEMRKGKYIGGGITGSILGFGIGHAIQGRYMPKGLVFTLTEAAALTAFAIGVGQCFDSAFSSSNRSLRNCDGGLMVIGYAALIGFHIWEVVDLWVVPPMDNRRYRRLMQQQEEKRTAFSIFPASDSKGGIAGAGLGFQYRF